MLLLLLWKIDGRNAAWHADGVSSGGLYVVLQLHFADYVAVKVGEHAVFEMVASGLNTVPYVPTFLKPSFQTTKDV